MDVLCHGLEKNGIVRAENGRGMASVNQTRLHCVNQMGKSHSKPLAARHWRGLLRVNRPLLLLNIEMVIKLKEEMGWACSSHASEEKCMQKFCHEI
jgi:hypothetical protein